MTFWSRRPSIFILPLLPSASVLPSAPASWLLPFNFHPPCVLPLASVSFLAEQLVNNPYLHIHLVYLQPNKTWTKTLGFSLHLQQKERAPPLEKRRRGKVYFRVLVSSTFCFKLWCFYDVSCHWLRKAWTFLTPLDFLLSFYLPQVSPLFVTLWSISAFRTYVVVAFGFPFQGKGTIFLPESFFLLLRFLISLSLLFGSGGPVLSVLHSTNTFIVYSLLIWCNLQHCYFVSLIGLSFESHYKRIKKGLESYVISVLGWLKLKTGGSILKQIS